MDAAGVGGGRLRRADQGPRRGGDARRRCLILYSSVLARLLRPGAGCTPVRVCRCSSLITVPWHWLAAHRLAGFPGVLLRARTSGALPDAQRAIVRSPGGSSSAVFFAGSMPWTLPALRVLGSGWRRPVAPAGDSTRRCSSGSGWCSSSCSSRSPTRNSCPISCRSMPAAGAADCGAAAGGVCGAISCSRRCLTRRRRRRPRDREPELAARWSQRRTAVRISCRWRSRCGLIALLLAGLRRLRAGAARGDAMPRAPGSCSARAGVWPGCC